MTYKTLTLHELFEHPQVCKTISKSEIEKISTKYQEAVVQKNNPLSIRIVSAIGAWFSALFLILFLNMAGLLKSGIVATVIGGLFFVAAIFVYRECKAVFFSQFALAMAITGNILVLLGPSIISRRYSFEVVVMIQIVVCMVIYPFFANAAYRYLAPLSLALLATAWIIEERATYSIHALIGLETFIFGFLILQKKRSSFLTPLIYSVASMLPATLLFMNLTQIPLLKMRFQPPLWISSVLLSAAIIYLFISLAGGIKRLHEPWLVLAIGSSVMLGLFTTPGILAAIGLLILGYNFGDRILSRLAYFFLPCFIVLYYYALNVDLAYKSWILVGSGIILLVVRWIAKYIFRAKEETV